MIQPNELTIGSLVYDKTHKSPAYVLAVMYKRYIGNVFVQLDSPNIRGSFTTSIENIEGIKLTEEILLKCGFVPHTVEKTFIKVDLIIDLELGIAMLDCINTTPLLCRCKYIHQLQNLYFALTNQELEIELRVN